MKKILYITILIFYALSSIALGSENIINTLKKGRTVIAIAHRLSTIRNAEIIYVLEDGRVVESGNHESLLDIEGVYTKLWSVQTGEKIN